MKLSELRYLRIGARVRQHGVLRGLRYSLGAILLYPVLAQRHSYRLAQYKAYKGMKPESLAVVHDTNPEPRMYVGTLADMVGQPEGVSGKVIDDLLDWRQRHEREAFRRGAMLEGLSLWRCDVPDGDELTDTSDYERVRLS